MAPGARFMPRQPRGGLELNPWQNVLAGGLQGIGNYLMAMGAGQSQQAPMAFAQGFQGFQDQQERRRQMAREDEIFQLRKDELSDSKAERDRKAAERAAAEAKFGELTALLTDNDPSNDPTGIKDILPFLPYEQQVQLAPELFAKPQGPQSAWGKMAADVKAGLVTPEQFADWVRKETYITPPAGSSDNVSLTPFYTTDAQGNVQMWQPSRSGVPVQVQLPEGINPAKPLSFQDLGTSVVGVQPLGGQSQVVLPKDVAGQASQQEQGQLEGAAIANMPSVLGKAEQAKKLIEDIRNDPAREAGTGISSLLNVVPGTRAFDFKQKVLQLQGQSFLSAFESLKGGGQITQIEGEKATQAIARLNTAQTEEGFLKALKDLEDVIDSGIARAKEKAGQDTTAPTPPANDAADPLGIRDGVAR
jgi:hypothetical protein